MNVVLSCLNNYNFFYVIIIIFNVVCLYFSGLYLPVFFKGKVHILCGLVEVLSIPLQHASCQFLVVV